MPRGLVLYIAVQAMIYSSNSIAQHHHTNNNPYINLSITSQLMQALTALTVLHLYLAGQGLIHSNILQMLMLIIAIIVIIVIIHV